MVVAPQQAEAQLEHGLVEGDVEPLEIVQMALDDLDLPDLEAAGLDEEHGEDAEAGQTAQDEAGPAGPQASRDFPILAGERAEEGDE